MSQFLKAIGSLIILAALIVGTGVAVKVGLSWLFEGVDPGVSTAIVAAVTTIVVSVGGVVLGRYLERRQQVEVEIRERKIPVYDSMTTQLLDGVFSGKDGNTEVLETLFRDVTPKLVTWASDDVIRAWTKFRKFAIRNSGENIELMFLFEEILKAVRQDLGHKSNNLEKGDLLGLFINDIDDFLPR